MISKVSRKEFIAMMASLMSLSAMSISTLLPALDLIKKDLEVQSANHIQFVISIIYVGMVIVPVY